MIFTVTFIISILLVSLLLPRSIALTLRKNLNNSCWLIVLVGSDALAVGSTKALSMQITNIK